MDSTLRQISQSLNELESYDADLRFMALNDLHNILCEDEARQLATQRILSRVASGILNALKDTVTEVQNQAVKALGALVVVYESELKQILTEVIKSNSSAKELAIRAVLTNAAKTQDIALSVISLVLPVISKNQQPSIEGTDVFLELVKSYSADFTLDNINTALETAKLLTGNSSGLISKRAFDIILLLSPKATPQQFESLVSFAIDVERKPSQFIIGALGLLTGLVNECTSNLHADLAPLAIQFSAEEDEETIDVRESALQLLEALVAHKLANNNDIHELISSCIDYNPNLGDLDADDMDEDSEFADSEIEEDFDDDSEDSWKVRRVAVRIVTAMLTSGDADSAVSFVPQLMNVIKYESSEAVKKELLYCLTLLAKPQTSRGRRNSDASMKLNEGVLSEYVDKIIGLAKADPETAGYLPLVANLCEYYDISDTETIVDICLFRVDTYKSKQILQCLQVTRSILLNTSKCDPTKILKIISFGLQQSLFKLQSLALECAGLLDSLEILQEVENVIANGVSAAIRGAAFDTNAKVLANHPTCDLVDPFIQLATERLATDVEQRAATVNSLVFLFHQKLQVSAATIEKLTVQLFELFSFTSPTITCSCLDLLDLIVMPSTANNIAAKVLELPNDVQYIDLKCKIIAHAPTYPGALEFALEVAKIRDYDTIKVPLKDAKPNPLIALFGKLAEHVPSLLKSVSAAYSETPLWAEIVAEVIYRTDAPTPDSPTPLNTWYVMVALFLTLRGRTVFTELFNTTGIDPIVAGYCIGATTINAGTSEQFLNTVSNTITETPEVALSGVEVVIMRSSLSEQGYEQAWAAAHQLTQQQFTEEKEQAILARIIGALYAYTSSNEKFRGWDDTVTGLNASKEAFLLAQDDRIRSVILNKFISSANSNDIKVKAIGAKALAWIAQINPAVFAPYYKDILQNAANATVKDKSLIRIVQIGPHKHEIDGGLDYRKASYELIYLCYYNFPKIIVQDDLWLPVLNGLDAKEDNDIKVLACLIIQQIARKDIIAVAHNLRQIVSLFSATESLDVKETAIKLEHDKKAAIVRQIQITKTVIKEMLQEAHINDQKVSKLMNEGAAGDESR